MTHGFHRHGGRRSRTRRRARQRTYTILGAWDGDPEKHILSYLTTIGQALLGHRWARSINLPDETGGRRAHGEDRVDHGVPDARGGGVNSHRIGGFQVGRAGSPSRPVRPGRRVSSVTVLPVGVTDGSECRPILVLDACGGIILNDERLPPRADEHRPDARTADRPGHGRVRRATRRDQRPRRRAPGFVWRLEEHATWLEPDEACTPTRGSRSS